MSIDYYHTRVRQAISDELVKCDKRQQEYLVEHNVVLARLASEKDTLPYSEYVRLERKREYLSEMRQLEKIKYDVWDQAREICLNIADEMEDTK